MMETYKLVVLGSGGVGKSSLVLQFVRHTFCDEYDPTVEDAYQKEMELDGERIKVEIMDTAGQEAFSSMRDDYIYNGEGFLLVYSLRCKQSYMEIPTFHRQIQRIKNADFIPCVIVETMCDLADSEHKEVPEGQGEQLATQLQTPFVRTSAKKRINIDKCFYTILRLLKDFKKQSRDKEEQGYCCVLL